MTTRQARHVSMIGYFIQRSKAGILRREEADCVNELVNEQYLGADHVPTIAGRTYHEEHRGFTNYFPVIREHTRREYPEAVQTSGLH